MEKLKANKRKWKTMTWLFGKAFYFPDTVFLEPVVPFSRRVLFKLGSVDIWTRFPSSGVVDSVYDVSEVPK